MRKCSRDENKKVTAKKQATKRQKSLTKAKKKNPTNHPKKVKIYNQTKNLVRRGKKKRALAQPIKAGSTAERFFSKKKTNPTQSEPKKNLGEIKRMVYNFASHKNGEKKRNMPRRRERT